MGKNAQRKRGQQPTIDHFIMSADTYVAVRRYLGSRPHDECRDLVMHLEQMPAVTADDIALREKQAACLADFEAAFEKENISAGEGVAGKIVDKPEDDQPVLADPDSPPGEPDPDADLANQPEEE